MVDEIIRPIDEASAKAIAEVSIFGGKIVDASSAGGKWLSSVLGKLPHNLVGIIDDEVAHIRARRWIELNADLDRCMVERGVKERIEPSFTVVLPLIEAAIEETRKELKELWERLLANACDPSRTGRVRTSFIVVLKKLDPLDARVLQAMSNSGQLSPNARDFLQKALQVSNAEIMVSFENLTEVGLIFSSVEKFNPHITDKGALLMRALEP
jgi:hypothetical protein